MFFRNGNAIPSQGIKIGDIPSGPYAVGTTSISKTWDRNVGRPGHHKKFDPNDSTQLLPMNSIGSDGKYMAPQTAFTDIDDAPSKTYLLEQSENKDIKPFLDLAVAKRPEFELCAFQKDPFCLENLAGKPEFSKVENRSKSELLKELKKTKDSRIVEPDKEIFDSYKRYSLMRKFSKPVSSHTSDKDQ